MSNKEMRTIQFEEDGDIYSPVDEVARESIGDISSLNTSDKTNLVNAINEISNNSGSLTEETDPTVPDWAKQPSKPTYTASEVGADASGTANSLINTHNTANDSHSDIREAINKLSLEKTNKNLLTLGIHTDGLLYIFYNNTPIGNGIEMYQDGDVFGYVDTDNNIIVKGNLDNGTYSVKYEMEDGSIVNIGDLVLDNNIYYSVTNNLTNCTNNNSIVQVVKGGNYSAIISANSGYELSSVTVTMGGTDITPSAVSGGNISIASVTGNIVITAVAAEIQTEPANPTNFAEPNETNKTDWSIWCNDARFGSDGGYRELTGNAVTNYIPFQFGDVIYIKGMTIATTGTSMNNGLVTYGSDKTKKTASYLLWYIDQNYLTVTSDESTPYIIDTTNLSGLASASGSEYFRLSGVVSGALDAVVINIKRNGKWL